MTERRPCWATVNAWAVTEEGCLPRVLAAMDVSYARSEPWGQSPGRWTPPYARPLDAGHLPGPPNDNHIRFAASCRERVAAPNRAMRDAMVHLLRVDGWRALLVSGYDGSWLTYDRANRGDDLITLGMWRWSCSYGRAGNRIARICGIDVPTIERAPIRRAA